MHADWERLVIEDEIGYGAYGTVYRVNLDGRSYARKRIVVPRDEDEYREMLSMWGSPELVREYSRESAAKLMEEISILQKFRDHPNIVSVLDSRLLEKENGFEIDILMECLKPYTEYETIHEMKEEDVLRLGIDLCSALCACEKEKVLHRDLKIANILVSEDGTFKLCDFGTAKQLEKTLTENSVKGTFTYMAPEVYHGKSYNNRADIYSLGMILYRIMNRGREPFIPADQRMIAYGEREAALNRRMNGEALPPPADASDELAEVLLKACAYYPGKRYGTAEEFQKELQQILNGEREKKGKPSSEKYGKRGAAFYKKAAAVFVLFLILTVSCGAGGSYIYREYFVNLCDQEIIGRLREDYGFISTARLNGNGTLFLEKDQDLLCTVKNREYPWMNKKDAVQKIVFGKEMKGLNNDEYETEMFVDENLFRSCRNLREIRIEGDELDLTLIGGDPFAGDTNLLKISCRDDASIHLEDETFSDSAWIRSAEYVTLGTTFYKYNGSAEEVSGIPDRVVRIQPSAFKNNSTVREITLPEGLEFIGSSAFSGCTQLSVLCIPSSVGFVERDAFLGCKSLTGLTVLPGTSSYCMKDGALYNADMTELIWCSPAVSGSFAIPETVKSVSQTAMEDCSEITSLTLPDMENITAGSFSLKCPGLTSFHISETGSVFSLIDGILCIHGQDGRTTAAACLKDVSGEITVPEDVFGINQYAFYACSGLTKITVPDSVQFIMSSAFEDCGNLETVILPGSLSALLSHAFDGCTNLKDIWYGGSEEEWERLTGNYDIGINTEKTTVHFV